MTEGESYTVSRAGRDDGLPSSETAYTLKSVAGAVATIGFSFKETSGSDRASAQGTWTVNAETGAPQSLDLALKGFKTGFGELVSYKLTRL